MAATHRYLELRGDLQALAASGERLVVTSVHPEGQPAAVAWVDVGKGTRVERRLPDGGSALVLDDDAVFVAGTDGHVHRGADGGTELAALTAEPLDPAPAALALLAGGRLAVTTGHAVVVLRSGQSRLSGRRAGGTPALPAKTLLDLSASCRKDRHSFT